MIVIKKINVKGYFGRGNFEWELDPSVNILGGKNGSGKSSLFKLCYALLSGDDLEDSLDKKFSNIFEEVTLTFSNKWKLIWKKQGEIDTYTIISGPTPSFVRNNALQIIDDEEKSRNVEDLKKMITVYMINSFEQHVADATKYEQQPKSEKLDNPTMLDLMIKDQIDQRNKEFSMVMEDFVSQGEEDEVKRSEYIETYKKTYLAINKFLSNYELPKSTFEFIKNGQVIRYEHLSMGEKQILLLMLMVGNTKQQPCIFFMDEPDLSMHIDWKEILVTELHNLNPNMQIILSTHAPSVITGWHDKVKEVSQLVK